MVVDGGTVLISIDFAVQAQLSELLEEGGVDEFARQATEELNRLLEPLRRSFKPAGPVDSAAE